MQAGWLVWFWSIGLGGHCAGWTFCIKNYSRIQGGGLLTVRVL